MKALTITVSLSILLAACGTQTLELAGPPASGSRAIAWGPQVGTSGFSAVSGAEDGFALDLGDALVRAARTAPNGASQSSDSEDGRTGREVTVEVVRDAEGNPVYEVSDGSFFLAHAPGPPRQGFDLALFAGVPAGIEPDPSSYPHELVGLWTWNGEVGAFWYASPSVPQVGFGDSYPVGRATYEGDAVGLHAAGSVTTKFLADVTLVADVDGGTVGGTVDRFRTFAGEALGGLTATLEETGFSADGVPFSGATSAEVAGSGRWGARWSDGEGRSLGGTFGFAEDNLGVAVLGAFSASVGTQDTGGNPDDPVSTTQ